MILNSQLNKLNKIEHNEIKLFSPPVTWQERSRFGRLANSSQDPSLSLVRPHQTQEVLSKVLDQISLCLYPN